MPPQRARPSPLARPPPLTPQATDEHVVAHSVGRGEAAFDPRRRGGHGGAAGGGAGACSSLFTEPMAWMAGIDGARSGVATCADVPLCHLSAASASSLS